MKDKQGRRYARLDDLKVGDLVQVDGDFDCMVPWTFKTVQQDADEDKLFIACTEGKHYLDGQLDHDSEEGWLMGIYPAKKLTEAL